MGTSSRAATDASEDSAKGTVWHRLAKHFQPASYSHLEESSASGVTNGESDVQARRDAGNVPPEQDIITAPDQAIAREVPSTTASHASTSARPKTKFAFRTKSGSDTSATTERREASKAQNNQSSWSSPQPVRPVRCNKWLSPAGSNVSSGPNEYVGAFAGSSPGYVVDGGCFAGSSLAHLANGSFRSVESLKKGDRVKCNENTVAGVVCVLAMRASEIRGVRVSSFVRFSGGLTITPSHPIWQDGQWQLPRNIGESELLVCDKLFNVLLDSGHTMLVNDVVCVTLGHSRRGPTASSFWGDWAKMKCCLATADPQGFLDGHVEVRGVLRRKDTGTAFGLETVAGKVVSGHSARTV